MILADLNRPREPQPGPEQAALVAEAPSWDPAARHGEIDRASREASNRISAVITGLHMSLGPAVAAPLRHHLGDVDEQISAWRWFAESLRRSYYATVAERDRARDLAAALEAELAARPAPGTLDAVHAYVDVLEAYLDTCTKTGTLNAQAIGRVRARGTEKAEQAREAAAAVQLTGPGRSIDGQA